MLFKKINILNLALLIVSTLTFPCFAEDMVLVPHFHWDLAWLDTEAVYAERGADLIKDYVDEAEEDPQFKFVLDQVPLMEAAISKYPTYESKLRNLIANGQLEISGGLYCQPDENLVSGETLCRNIIFGQQYWEDNWGLRSRGCWNIDSFGHTLQLPQLATEGGMEYFSFMRGGDLWPFPNRTEFYWEAPDGSRLLTHYMFDDWSGYLSANDVGDSPFDNTDIQNTINKLAPYDSTGLIMGMNGADFAAAKEYLSEAIANWNSSHFNKVSNGLPTEFFQQVKDSSITLPTIEAEEFQRRFRGCYSSHIHFKQDQSRIENLLLNTEKIAALASMTPAEVLYDYPKVVFDEASIALALNSDHDYITGAGVDSAQTDVSNRYTQTEAMLDATLDDALQFLAGEIGSAPTNTAGNTDSKNLIIFNTLNWEREEIVEATLRVTSPFQVVDHDGLEVAYQITGSDSSSTTFCFEAKAPSFGYTTYHLNKGVIPATSPQEAVEPVTDNTYATTQYASLQVDQKGHFLSLLDKTASPARGLFLPQSATQQEALSFDHRHFEGANQAIPVRLFHIQAPIADSSFLERIILPDNELIHLAAITLEDDGLFEAVRLTGVFDTDGVSFNDSLWDADLDGRNGGYPGEDFPTGTFVCANCNDVPFEMGPVTHSAEQFVRCSGESISVPAGMYTNIHLLAMAVNTSTIQATAILKYEDGSEVPFTFPVTDWAQSPPAGSSGTPANTIAWEQETTGDAYWYGNGGATGSSNDHTWTTTRYDGPVMTRIVTSGDYVQNSPTTREVRIYHDNPRIDCHLDLDWKGMAKNLYLTFPINPNLNTRTDGVPYGHVQRPDGRYPVQKWSDIGNTSGGLTVIANGLPDQDYSGDTLRITILRSMDVAAFRHYNLPSELMKAQWLHQYDYALYPHSPDWKEANSPHRAWEFQNPLLVVQGSENPSGALPSECSFLESDNPMDSILTVFQRDEENNLVLRLYETRGETTALTLNLPHTYTDEATDENLLGDFKGDLSTSSKIPMTLLPQDVRTIHVNCPDGCLYTDYISRSDIWMIK